MPKDRVLRFGSEAADRLFAQLSYAACAVCADIKPAVLFHVRGAGNMSIWAHHGGEFAGLLGLGIHLLSVDDRGYALLCYRPGLLWEMLGRPCSQKLLRELGYPDTRDLTDYLVYLTRRYHLGDYPHEIGIFLGYPAHDVKGYIENGGRDWLACRYWKVYDDPEGAAAQFCLIDHCKKAAVTQLLQCACPS